MAPKIINSTSSRSISFIKGESRRNKGFQKKLAKKTVIKDCFRKPLTLVAVIDISFKGDIVITAYVEMSFFLSKERLQKDFDVNTWVSLHTKVSML